ncbi:MAG: hypothetical protein HC800_17475 [Phormidesmis sp. RL_2_1]|nr:hypothetical protein [Phormidesmis sp. RL_2_1]
MARNSADNNSSEDRIAAIDTTNNGTTSELANSPIDSNQTDGIGIDSTNFSTLEEAGNYIQRQKRVEVDPIVSATEVTIIPAADATASNPTDAPAAQGDTAVNPQPEPTTTPQPATTPAATPVQALW